MITRLHFVTCSVAGQHNSYQRWTAVSERAKHVDLKTLIDTLLPAGAGAAFVQLDLDTRGPKPLPDCAELGWNGPDAGSGSNPTACMS